MRNLILLTFVMSLQAFAKPPECPIHPNKRECLQSVDQNFHDLLDFLEEEYNNENKAEKIEMIDAANDIKYYESLACQKTCLN
jgi:hypothetical protein